MSKTPAIIGLVTVVITLAPMNPQCDDIVFARANPGMCQVNPTGPFPDLGGSAPHPGGILGTIGRILGGIGGLL